MEHYDDEELREILRKEEKIEEKDEEGEDDNDDDDDDDDDNDAIPENAQNFDTHMELARMDQKVPVFEAGKIYRIFIMEHPSIVFPGETLSLVIPKCIFNNAAFPDEDMLFGMIFQRMQKTVNPDIYGVTCQIYEWRNEAHTSFFKCRSLQRFVISKKDNPNFNDLLKLRRHGGIHADVRILPEILLPDPLSSSYMGSLNRFRDIDSMSEKFRRWQASTTVWPTFVFDQYNFTSVIERAKKCFPKYKFDSMPTDYTLLSFWFADNLVFDTNERIKIFQSDSINTRMQIIGKYLEHERFYYCRRCRNKVANCSSLLANSKHGVQSYCGLSGFIHEINTVCTVLKDAVCLLGTTFTAEFLFLGYSRQLMSCRLCDVPLGWKFVSTKSNLVPKKFYGLSERAVDCFSGDLQLKAIDLFNKKYSKENNNNNAVNTD